jgi:hypothetical protein
MSKYLLSVIAFLLLFSCTVEKRLYRPGWHVEFRNHSEKAGESAPAVEIAAGGEQKDQILLPAASQETDDDIPAPQDAKPAPGGAPAWEEIPVSKQSHRIVVPRSERLRQHVLYESEFRSTVRKPFLSESQQTQKIQKKHSSNDPVRSAIILVLFIASVLVLMLIAGLLITLFTSYMVLGYSLMAIALAIILYVLIMINI